MTHMMVDIETLGTTPGCAILSIGACVFGPDGIGKTFYRSIDIGNTKLSIDPRTVKWWMQQGDEARKIFSEGISEKTAFDEFSSFWRATSSKYLWCHGATFDAPILSAAGCCPWDFRNVRDTRTVFHLSGIQPARHLGTHHHALDDAVAQSLAIIASLEKLGWPS